MVSFPKRTVPLDTVPDGVLLSALKTSVEQILRADGDRDYMNHSDLTVQQTTAIADFIRLAIKRLEAHG